MSGQQVGYIRVSTLDQKVDRQLIGVELDRTFADTASGKDVNRPKLAQMITYVRDGDTVVVHSMDRLARNLVDLRGLVGTLTRKGVRVQFIKENLTFTAEASPLSQLLLNVMGSFADHSNKIRDANNVAEIAGSQAFNNFENYNADHNEHENHCA